ncbi:unnamed protein product [Calypogeia fissa]
MTSASSLQFSTMLVVVVAMVLGLLPAMAVGAVHVTDTAKLGEEGWPQVEGNAAVATIEVGDTLRFQYNNELNNLMEVTEAAMTECNTSAPLREWTDGDTSILFLERGAFFYIWGHPGHCLTNQRLTVEVTDYSAEKVESPQTKQSHHSMLLEADYVPCNFDCPDNAQPALKASDFWILPLLALGFFCL